MNTLPVPKPLVVAILDGWGISFLKDGNAIASAATPTIDMFGQYYPTAAVAAAGTEVGLPWGEVGNSETGHSTIGAGQVRYQERSLIDQEIKSGAFYSNRALLAAIEHAKKHNSKLHIMGLLSPGGVHAHQRHLYAILDLVKLQNFTNEVYIHAFTDGRDTPPRSAALYVKELEEYLTNVGVGEIASVTGRLYAMDRNQNWDRTHATYDLLTGGPRGPGAATASKAVDASYRQGVFDEKIAPTAITRGGGPVATVQANDAVMFFNYRPDRARQLTRAFIDANFTAWKRPLISNLLFVTMTEHDDEFAQQAAFRQPPVKQPVASLLSRAGLKQLHIAETEKYAHVTYYLNGGREEPFPGEDHILIRSSATRDFATEPEMAADALTDRIVTDIKKGMYDVYFINYANADMVAHTGNFEAAITACSFVDSCLARIHEAIQSVDGALLVTADHGNAEEMKNPQTGDVETDHTSNPVPLYYIRKNLARQTPRSESELTTILSSPIGVLADIGPTILDITHVPKAPEMTGVSLLPSLQ